MIAYFSFVNFFSKDQKETAVASPSHAPKSELSADEMRNIGLIMDVRLPIRVRIGSKKMLLKDGYRLGNRAKSASKRPA